MAELLKNELTIEVRDGMVHSQRVIQDKQPYDEFIGLVAEQESALERMRQLVDNFEEIKQSERVRLKTELAGKRKLKDFDKVWEQHEMGMLSQYKQWKEREIPNIESEIDILREARDKALAAAESEKSGKKE